MFTDAMSSLPIYSVQAFSDATSSLPDYSVRAFSDETPSLPCTPCSGKSRFDLVYILYFLTVSTLLLFTL